LKGRWIWWWVSGLLLAAFYVFVAIDNQTNPAASPTDSGRDSILLVAVAVLLLVGLALAQRPHVAGIPMVILGALPAFAFYWTVLIPLLGIAVIGGVIFEAVDKLRRSSRT